ncbi:brain tumor protein-like isoform X3 [Limulus polyphemus]|nr:brain tumor protein-like isoform X3 [Limulus polyphemus]XP_022249889.1 brain tumor protein-like isoform X3 [Limulus polyphemus]XP_022249890.1 brain tumor protein-like isoform X3 [Limulus polyphemus]
MASPTPSLPDSTAFSSTSVSTLGDQSLEDSISTKCFLCQDTYTIPKVLPCFHTFCQPCLEKIQESPDNIKCPQCHQECILTGQGIGGLLSDYAISNILESTALEGNSPCCTGCKSKESNAVAHCFDCANFLCSNCVMAHQFMHCFEGHRVLTLSELQNNKDDIKMEKPINCTRHKNELLKYFCQTCNIPICKECSVLDHPKGLHDFEYLKDVASQQVETINHMIENIRVKVTDLRNVLKTIEHSTSRLQMQYQRAENEIKETFQFYCSMLEEKKEELLKEVDGVYNTRMMSLSILGQEIQRNIEKIIQLMEFVDRIMKFSSNTEILIFKQLLDSKFQGVLTYNPDIDVQDGDLEFVSNFQAIQIGVRNTFGYIRQSSEMTLSSKPQAIARPNGVIGSERTYHNGHSTYESNILSKRFSSANSLSPFLTNLGDLNPYEKWSSAPNDNLQNGSDTYSLSSDQVTDLSSKLLSSTIYPLKSQIKRQKMIYHCKFGEFGVMEGQFTEPSGVAVNAQCDIIVADTNNHRIQIFDIEGRFKFQFGECGKRDGQLLYPNRVAVVKTSGDIIVTERSPTHQIQIYNQYGQFVRKFGANILQHPRGVTVDSKGRIIVVECKVMRVIIFDQLGNVLQKFGCSKHLEFPNGVVVNDKQEIFISDNRAHCVKVFNYDGVFLRQIGGEGLTNYPIGVCINQNDEILVADNHNNFNITIFTQDGQLVNALESKVKHAQCFDVALVENGSVVLASKDYRIYVYRYMQIPGIGI